MRTLILDTETRSAKDLRSCGPYVYSEDPIQYVDGQVIDGFEMLMVSWQFLDKGKTRWWSPLDADRSDGTLIDEFYSSLTDPDVRKIAHNAQFDRVILSRRLQRGGVLGRNEFLDPRQWIDTMAVAAVHGLPKGLDHLVKFYKVGGKLSDGKAVIQFFNKFSNRLLLEEALSKDDLLGELAELLHVDRKLSIDVLRNLPAPRGFATEKKHLLQLYDVREKWKTYRSYSIHDTDILVDVAKKLPRIPEEEQRFWELDQEINDRGVLIDLDLAKSAYHRFQVSSEAVTNDLKKIMACENPRSIPQFKNWLGLAGVEVSSLDKAHVETLLLAPDTPPIVKKALEMRQTISASSTAKFTAMEDRCNHDGRARGCFQYFGAHTGRAAGRGIQLQNLPRIPGKQVPLAEFLADNPELLATASLDQVKYMLRACLIAPPGDVFSIADFSSIEARVTAWLAGEQWVLDSARAGHDLYKATWSAMAGVTVDQVTDDERQRGKVACLAEGTLVLTDRGLVEIQKVASEDLVWDGVEWVTQDGPIYMGRKEVMTYDGLTATGDHRVWIEGERRPVQLRDAATSGARLVQSGAGREALRVGDNNVRRAEVPDWVAALVCKGPVSGVRIDPLVSVEQPSDGSNPGMSVVQSTEAVAEVARSAVDSSSTTMYESERSGVPELRRSRDSVRVPVHPGSRTVDAGELGNPGQGSGDRPHRQQWSLRSRELEMGDPTGELGEPKELASIRMGSEVLALREEHGTSEVKRGRDTRADYRGSGAGSSRKAEVLEDHPTTVRVYDLLNAGPRHRFTANNVLVHNCLALGYAGGVKALLRMGGDKLPIPDEFAEHYRQQLVEEHELMRPPKAQAEAYRAWRRWNLDTEFDMTVRDAYLDDLKLTWRAANPSIKRFWYDVANGFKTAAFLGHQTEVGRLIFAPCEGKNTCGIRLPSGRVMKYRFIRTKVEVDEDGRKRDALVFRNGIGITVYTHGGKLVENVVQAVARDLLRDAMLRASDAGARIVAHIHDEIVAEGQFDLASFMVDNPSWAPGLPLNASVAETSRYLGH